MYNKIGVCVCVWCGEINKLNQKEKELSNVYAVLFLLRINNLTVIKKNQRKKLQYIKIQHIYPEITDKLRMVA